MDPLNIKTSLNQLKDSLDKTPLEFLEKIKIKSGEDLTVYLEKCKVTVLNISQLTRYRLGLKAMIDLWHHIGLDPYKFCRNIKRHFFLKLDESEFEGFKIFLEDINNRHAQLPTSHSGIDLPFYLRAITEHTFYGLLTTLAQNPTPEKQLKFNFIWNKHEKDLYTILKQEGLIENSQKINIVEALKILIMQDELLPTLEDRVMKRDEIEDIIKMVSYIKHQGALVAKENNIKKLKI